MAHAYPTAFLFTQEVKHKGLYLNFKLRWYTFGGVNLKFVVAKDLFEIRNSVDLCLAEIIWNLA